MSLELNLRFADAGHVLVSFDGEESGSLPFASPFTARDRQDLIWYLEMYGAHSLGDPDDAEAARIAARLAALGRELFDAVFRGPALRLFQRFQDGDDDARLLTVSAEQAEILAHPWELMHDSAPGGVHLFLETPRISIRRRLPGATGGRRPFRVTPKERLRLLFVVSRPEGAGFIDPRAEARAVLDAIGEHAPGRIVCELLRPATLDALVDRLEDGDRPAVDILHFDGHGVFDPRGGLPSAAAAKDRRLAPADEVLRASTAGAGESPNTGYLLFENAAGGIDFVPAGKLGDNLHQHKVALVVLSACQSAALGEALGKENSGDGDPSERAMGSVAARLTAAGLPAVLAMTHSVLAATTRALFGEMYKDLARHRGIGEALDNARRHLANHPEKFEVQRGPQRGWLRLQDWFVPALYESGADLPLLQKSAVGAAEPAAAPAARSNLPRAPEAGFYGRRRELWQIETWLAGPTRRLTLAGFGGQGKTALALEAGRWLLRTGMFDAAVFVDYSRIQSADALGVAVSEVGSVLGESFPDAAAARGALAHTPTLVILDNLEALAAEPLAELLEAAVGWSAAGGSRLLLTTRQADLGHAAYRNEGTRVHRRIQLAGLGSRKSPNDALQWFGELMKLPPATRLPAPRRDELIELFAKVSFHPLSLRVLAQQAKTRAPAELGERLEQLLSQPASTDASDATRPELVASLQLSFDRLDPAARTRLPRLGVFQGGAMEFMLLRITGIPETEWSTLRRQLEAAALIEAEEISGVTVPFLRFHPTLSPMLWAQLGSAARSELAGAHRSEYKALAIYLYEKDLSSPHQARAIVRRELANLIQCAHQAWREGDEDAVEVNDRLISFLNDFGLRRESALLASLAGASAGEEGARSWYLAESNRGEQIRAAGRPQEATEVFQNILAHLPEALQPERIATLHRLGRCLTGSGRPDQAETSFRRALAEVAALATDWAQRERGGVLTDLGDALRDQGRYAEARGAYDEALGVYRELADLRSEAVALAQLGGLAMAEGDLAAASGRYESALTLFQQLSEPAHEAVIWHQMGRMFEASEQWAEAERHHREAARIREDLGLLGVAAGSWNQLAIVNERAGKPAAAAVWYGKVIEVADRLGDVWLKARALGNLADLLANQDGDLAEARRLGEEAVHILEGLDPSAAEIWKGYGLLARISHREGDQPRASRYRRLAREARRAFAGTRQSLRRHGALIIGTVVATVDPRAPEALAPSLAALEQNGWADLVAAVRRILAGERDLDRLEESLDVEDSMIVEAILAGIADSDSLADLQPPNG